MAKPYHGICSARCWSAKGKRCRCKCHGKHHGKGLTENHKLDQFRTEDVKDEGEV